MNEQDLKAIDVTIEQAREVVKLYEAYKFLSKNKYFKLLIEETYFLNHASRLVLLRGDSNVPEENQAAILKEIDAIGTFRSFLRDVVGSGRQAEDTIRMNEETREEILAEDSQ